MNKSFSKILYTIIILCFAILLYNRILIYFFEESIVGYLIERVVFFVFIIASIIIYKRTIYKKVIVFAMIFILLTNFIRAFFTGIICTNYEKKITDNLYLRESTALETNTAFHIMSRNSFSEKNITYWNSNHNYDEAFRNLKDIQSINLIKQKDSLIILEYKNKSKIKIDTFKIIE